jgi:galactokinase
MMHPPPPEFLAALRGLKNHRASSESALKDRETLARKTLENYDKAGAKAMLDIARRAQHLQREKQRVEAEVARLENGEEG